MSSSNKGKSFEEDYESYIKTCREFDLEVDPGVVIALKTK